MKNCIIDKMTFKFKVVVLFIYSINPSETSFIDMLSWDIKFKAYSYHSQKDDALYRNMIVTNLLPIQLLLGLFFCSTLYKSSIIDGSSECPQGTRTPFRPAKFNIIWRIFHLWISENASFLFWFSDFFKFSTFSHCM